MSLSEGANDLIRVVSTFIHSYDHMRSEFKQMKQEVVDLRTEVAELRGGSTSTPSIAPKITEEWTYSSPPKLTRSHVKRARRGEVPSPTGLARGREYEPDPKLPRGLARKIRRGEAPSPTGLARGRE